MNPPKYEHNLNRINIDSALAQTLLNAFGAFNVRVYKDEYKPCRKVSVSYSKNISDDIEMFIMGWNAREELDE